MRYRAGGAVVLGVLLALALSAEALGHEVREVGDYTFVVGFIDEPVYAGQKSGLEFSVTTGDEQPVEGLEETLQGEVIHEGETQELPLSPRFGEPGWYESVFFPTAAGQYSFHIFGEIEGVAVDESFTSGEETFGDVADAASGQFPVVFPPTGDIVRDAEAGAAASGTATLALVLGGAGLVVGLVALGLTLARRRG
jgi:hypothetical protein